VRTGHVFFYPSQDLTHVQTFKVLFTLYQNTTTMHEPQKIGFIGLGNMGAPMAKNLLRAGFDVMVYNRTVSKAAVFQSTPAKIAASLEDLAKHAEVVITMLSDDAAVNAVCDDISRDSGRAQFIFQ
jgi:pyrroline-5-carboxylate reductase